MTEREFYREFLAAQVVDKDRLLEEVKHAAQKKKARVIPWVKAAAAVFLVIAAGSVGWVRFGNLAKVEDNMFEVGMVQEDGVALVKSGAAENGKIGNAESAQLTLLQEDIRSLAENADCIVTAKAQAVKSGVASLQVAESFRGGNVGETITVPLAGAVEGREYLLFLKKDGAEYRDLLSADGELYEADSARGVYYPSSLPEEEQPLSDVRKLVD